MSTAPTFQPTGLDQFLAEFYADRDHGRDLPLEHYTRRYPDLIPQIQAEFEAFERLSPASTKLDAGDTEAPRSRAGHPKVIGPYEVVRVLGSGGQGFVYLARDSRLNRFVALKVLRWTGRPPEDVIRRFRHEAKFAGSLDHPNLCTVYEIGVHDNEPYIAMRYVEGETLAQHIKTAREHGLESTYIEIDSKGHRRPTPVAPLPETSSAPPTRHELRQTLELIEQCARAIEVAHQGGIIHRDIKPGNIMVTPQGTPVILDFGMARSVSNESSLHSDGCLLGTFHYMSPEQLDSTHITVDHRTDVWSLGVTLYEALTLRRPFDAQTDEGLFDAIRHREPMDPRRINRAVSRDLRTVLETALQKNRNRRYRSALAFAEDLRRLRMNEPILARPITPLVRLSRWARRNRLAAALLGAVLIVLAGALAIALWFLHREEGLNGRLASTVQNLTDTNRQLSGTVLLRDAAGALEYDPALALKSAIEGTRRCPGEEGRNLLYRALEALREVKTIDDVRCIGCSPDVDRIAVAHGDGTVEIVDFTGTTLAVVRTGRRGIEHVLFNDALHRLSVGNGTPVIAIYDTTDGREIGQITHGQTAFTQAATSSGTIGASFSNHEIALWNLRDATVIHRTTTDDATVIRNVLPLGDGGLAAVIDQHARLDVMDLKSGQVVKNLLPGGDAIALDTSLWLAAGGAVFVLRCGEVPSQAWSTTTWEPTDIGSAPTASHASWPSPRGDWRVDLDDPRSPVLVETARPAHRARLLGHHGMVKQVAFARASERVGTFADDGTFRLWMLRPRSEAVTLSAREAQEIAPLFTPAGQRAAATPGELPTLTAADPSAVVRSLAAELGSAAHTHRLTAAWAMERVVVSRDGRFAAVTDPDDGIVVWDLVARQRVWRTAADATDVRFLGFSDDASALFVMRFGCAPCIVRLPAGVLVSIHNPTPSRNFIVAGPGARRLAMVSGVTDDVVIVDGISGQALARLVGTGRTARDAVFSHDGALLFALSDDGGVRAYSTSAPFTQIRHFRGHSRAATSAAVSADDLRLATIGDDRTVRLWDVGSGESLGTIETTGGRLVGVTFSDDGSRVITLDADGALRGFPVDVFSAAVLALPRREQAGAASRPETRR